MAVMYAGRIVEHGSVRTLFNGARHPYTRALLGSIAKLGSKEPLYAIPGQPPNLARLPPGCAFHPRCSDAIARCATDAPGETTFGEGWTASCWRAEAAPAKEAYDRASA
jgi:peptide/nickel transport system ATP-binding protein